MTWEDGAAERARIADEEWALAAFTAERTGLPLSVEAMLSYKAAWIEAGKPYPEAKS
jgi:hypothetical protein